ncbi:unnamed protein product [Arabidopsis thaliana]|uniref:(thale cress) hypothetical protein n=1 Tax=Arabidopsis thaliana TaxID=3702 RepID=A0A7G2F606_ARATH|nr:unnamed protein product [Arabidopsis thaliana]
MEIIIISLCLTTLLAFLFLKPLFKRITTTKPKLPPSPWRLPVIGNLHQLGPNPHRYLHSLSLRYGPLMLLHFGRVPVLVVSCPDVTNDIMKTHDLKFANRPKSKAINIFMEGGRDIIFGPYGEDWKSMKSLGVVHLLNNKMVRSFENLREEEIKVMTEKLEEASSSSSSVNLSKLLMTLTNDIICRITLGRKYNVEEGGIDIKNLVMTSSEFFGKFFFGDFIPSLAWIDWISGIDDKMKDINNKLDCFLNSMVQEHVDADHKEPSDFIDMLLLIQKDKTKRFQFDRSDLILILKEGLRLHPSGPLLFRLPSENVQLKGYDISAGTHVIINAWALQRNPAIWGLDADEYRPERHFGTNLDFNGTDSKFVPFGAGRRLCPGIGFSLVLSKLALANLVKRFNWRLKVGPAGDDKPDLAEASGIDVCRKFPLIVFPSIAHTH